MRAIILSLLLIVAMPSFVATQSDIKLKIGAKLPRKDAPRKYNEMMRTATNQFRPFIKRTIGKIDYTIAYDERTREIKFIYTEDKNFHTVNGLNVGKEIIFTAAGPAYMDDWEILTYETPDGWSPHVTFAGSSAGREFLNKLKPGTQLPMNITGFSKGGN